MTKAATTIALLCMLLAGCNGDAARLATEVIEATADGTTLGVVFSAPVELRQVQIADEQGQSVLTLPAAGTRRRFDFPAVLEPTTRYRLELRSTTATWQRELTTPAASLPLVAILEAPFGQQPLVLGSTARTAALVPSLGELPVALVVENRRQSASEFTLTLHLPPEVEFVGHASLPSLDNRDGYPTLTGQRSAGGSPAQTGGPPVLRLTGRLETEFEQVQWLGQLKLNRAATEATVRIVFKQWTGDSADAAEQQLDLVLRIATHDELARQIELIDVAFPADAQGRRRDEQLADAVVLPNLTWAWIRGLFRSSATLFNYHDAYGYQSLRVANRGEAPLNLLIESEVLDPLSREPSIDFAPPEWYSSRTSATAEHLLRAPPGTIANAQLPLFVRPEVSPGRYERRLRLYTIGSREPLLEISRPLAVLRGDTVVSAVALSSLLLCVLSWLLAACIGRRAIRHIGVEGLSTIGVIAALHFVVSYAAGMAGSLLSAGLGPFAVFVSGLGNEGLTSLLLATAVTLIPRVGTFALSGLTVFLLNALFKGQLGVVDALFVTLSVALGELCLACLGVTRFTTSATTGFPPARALRLAVAIGLANMVTLYAQFCLIEVLNRLFFAPWYVTAVAVMTGLIYGTAGALLGARLGFELRRTAR